MEELLTLEELSKILKISKPTLYKMVEKGKIPALKIANQWRFKRQDIVIWIEKQRISMDRRGELHKIAERCARVLKERYRVTRVFLIGSLVRGPIHKRSDIDMVVEGLSPELYIKALTELWDLLPPGVELNLIPYEEAYESLKEKTIKEGERVYG